MTTTPSLRRIPRRTALLLTPPLYSVINAAPAWAAGGGAGAVAWLAVTDSAAVPVGSYGLSINDGGITDPGTAENAMVVHWLYHWFQAVIGLALWLVNNVLSFQWLGVIAAPFDFIGRQISAIALSPAFIVAIGTIAACFIAFNVVRGHLSRAGAQILTAVLLGLMAVTLASKPISELVGPNGALAEGRDIGIEASSELSGKRLNGQQAVQETTNTLADHYARVPTLVWNFGADIDEAPYNCGGAWSTAIKTGDLDTVKDAVAASCPNGKALHDYAMQTASNQMAPGIFAFVFALAVLTVFGYLCYQVVILALSTLYWAIIAVVAAIVGFIPGHAQTLAVKAALDAVFSWLGMAAYVAIVGLAGALSAAMFAVCGNDVMAMPLVTMLLVAGFVALRRVRGGLVKARNSAARAVARFTGNADTGLGSGLERLGRH
jgi:hypothetical protein